MINLYSVCSDFITLLRQNSFFDNYLLCTSFPKSVKPTLLSHPAIAVSLGEVRFNDESIGQQVMAGSVSVSAKLFVPALIRNQVSPDEAIAQICKSAAGMRIVSLACEKPYVDKPADCTVQRIVITFSDEICFEEQENG